MSYWLAAAGILSFIFTAAHCTGGGDLVHLPILGSELSDVLKGYVSVIWHGTTTTMLVCSVLLLIAAGRPLQRITLSLIVLIHYALYTALFIFYGITRFQSVLAMPQWIGFVGISLIVLIGLGMNKDTTLQTVP